MRFSTLPIFGFVAAAAIVVMVLVAYGLLANGSPSTGTDVSPRPTAARSSEPTGVRTPPPAVGIGSMTANEPGAPANEGAVPTEGRGRLVRSDSTVSFAYTVPAGVAFTAWWPNGVPAGAVAFTTEGPGPYGDDCTPVRCTFVEGARGVVVADVTGATTAHEDDEELRDDPEGFLRDLDTKLGFRATDVVQGQLGALAAWTARVYPGETYPFLDSPEGAHPVTVPHPSYFVVALFGDRLLLVQVWAETDSELETWLPTAMEFVDSLEFARE